MLGEGFHEVSIICTQIENYLVKQPRRYDEHIVFGRFIDLSKKEAKTELCGYPTSDPVSYEVEVQKGSLSMQDETTRWNFTTDEIFLRDTNAHNAVLTYTNVLRNL